MSYHYIPKHHRLRLFPVPTDLIIEMGKSTKPLWTRVTENPLPEDTEFFRAFYDEQRGCLVLVLMSNDWSPVPEGSPILYAPTNCYEMEASQ